MTKWVRICIVRNHWGVENRLHWVLDVTCNEDLARLEPGKGSMRGKLKRAGGNDSFLINLLAQFAKIHTRLPC